MIKKLIKLCQAIVYFFLSNLRGSKVKWGDKEVKDNFITKNRG